MLDGFLDIAVTPSVKAAQRANGSGDYWENFKGRNSFDRFTDAEKQFIAGRDSFYMATVSETGWPYVQHRGGPPGFLHVIDDKTLAFPDFRGNRQYISVGNAAANNRAALFMMDYPNRRRLKIYARIELRDLGDDPALAAGSCDAGLQGEDRTRRRAASRRLQLELPAAHHAAVQRSRIAPGFGAGRASDCPAGSGKQGTARETRQVVALFGANIPLGCAGLARRPTKRARRQRECRSRRQGSAVSVRGGVLGCQQLPFCDRYVGY